jgi:pimeloyl-ACP methyl ester carboxylesterase
VDNSGLIDTSLSKVVKRLVFKSVAKAGRAITGSTKLRQLLYRFSRETDYYEAAPTQRETMKNILAEEISADLPLVQAPTLVVWGENDQVTPLKFGRLVARTIPRANLKIISGARHSPVYTHEQKVVDLIEEFIKENKD